MRRLFVSGSVMLAMTALSGCSLFKSNPVPPEPTLTGEEAQYAAWSNAVMLSPEGGTPEFIPLNQARNTVEKAESESRVDEFDSDALKQAKQALEEAEKAWDDISDKKDPDAEKLADIATKAHRAQSLARIARFTAKREVSLEKLHEYESQQESSMASSDMGEADSQQLIGQHVVPEMLGELRFKQGTAQLESDSHQVIDKLADLVQAHPQLGVGIFGFTSDEAPSGEQLEAFVDANPELKEQDLSEDQKLQAYQQGLSDARAQDVAQLLVQAGVDSQRIGTRGMGASHPRASNDSASGRRQNDRVEAVMVPLQQGANGGN